MGFFLFFRKSSCVHIGVRTFDADLVVAVPCNRWDGLHTAILAFSKRLIRENSQSSERQAGRSRHPASRGVLVLFGRGLLIQGGASPRRRAMRHHRNRSKQIGRVDGYCILVEMWQWQMTATRPGGEIPNSTFSHRGGGCVVFPGESEVSHVIRNGGDDLSLLSVTLLLRKKSRRPLCSTCGIG